MHKIDLCEKCAKEMGVTNSSTFSLADLLIKAEADRKNQDSEQVQRCPACGFTQENLSKTGRLGCSECYAVFGSVLSEAMKDMQRSLQHAGKMPGRFFKTEEADAIRKDIEEALEEAIEKENYEVAAQLRDQLKMLKKGKKA